MVKQCKTLQELTDEIGACGNRLMVIDFYATWCPPCNRIAPIIEKMAQDFPDVVFVKVDVDENQDASFQYQIQAMPTFLFMKNGQQKGKVVGACEEDILSNIQRWK